MHTFRGLIDFPSAGAPFVASTDLAAGESAVNQLLDQRQFRALGARSDAQVCFSHAPLKSGHLFAARHGVALHVTSAPIRSFQVMVPLQGRLGRVQNNREFAAGPGTAIAYSPGECMNTLWSQDCTAIVLNFTQEALLGFLRRLFPDYLAEKLAFDPVFDLTAGPGRSFANMLGALCREHTAPEASTVAGHIEEVMLLALLNGQYQIARQSDTRPRRHRDRCVSRAVEFIRDNCEADIGMADLVRVSAASARSLQIAFTERFGIGPMTFVKHLKLRKVREALQTAPTGATVGDVAARWGFYNGSTFAKAYFQLFGELPSQTLKAGAR